MPHDRAARTMLDKERRVIIRALFGSADAVLKPDTASSRNHYKVTAGNRTLEAMVDAGWMRRGATVGEIDRLYHVTPMGALAANLADRCRPEDLAIGDPVETAVLAALADVSGSLMGAVRPEMTMAELGLDSLGEIDLAMELEVALSDREGREIALPLDAIGPRVTAAELIATVRKAVEESMR